MGPKDVHLADRVSKPELPRGEIFLFIIIVLNLAVFSFGGSGGRCGRAEHLQIVKASCSRKIISVAAGLCKVCSCRSDLPGEGVEGVGLESGEALKRRRMKGASGPDGQGQVVCPDPSSCVQGQQSTDSAVPPLPLLG